MQRGGDYPGDAQDSGLAQAQHSTGLQRLAAALASTCALCLADADALVVKAFEEVMRRLFALQERILFGLQIACRELHVDEMPLRDA